VRGKRGWGKKRKERKAKTKWPKEVSWGRERKGEKNGEGEKKNGGKGGEKVRARKETIELPAKGECATRRGSLTKKVVGFDWLKG